MANAQKIKSCLGHLDVTVGNRHELPNVLLNETCRTLSEIHLRDRRDCALLARHFVETGFYVQNKQIVAQFTSYDNNLLKKRYF